MKRIFLTLAIVSALLLIASFVFGLEIGNPRVATAATRKWISLHVLISVAALIFACLVHAVLLTYFMGTGRWIEETSNAYSLSERWRTENRHLKYRAVPAMVGCLLLLILDIPLGAMAVDGTAWRLPAVGEVLPGQVHLIFSAAMILGNWIVNVLEYRAIARNGELIGEIVEEVRAIRISRGMPV